MKLLLPVISFLLLAWRPLVSCLLCSESRFGAYDKGRHENVWKMSRSDERSSAQKRNSECPALYQRYSVEHTFCKVSTCDIINEGVNEDDKKTILKIHNSLRSRLASGKERRYRELPSSANMMQLEWDDELARVAQAHASLCEFKHDNDSSRAVENFSVGQNLLQSTSSEKNWNLIESWYKEEVCFYLPKYIKPFNYQDIYGHFVQFTWATTWKIGCGFATYRQRGRVQSLYTCNYGPQGNLKNSVHYIEGKPCSQCPDNTECSTEYEGLCKSKTPDGPQTKRPSSQDYILLCDFRSDDPEECKNVKVTGSRNFSTRHIYTGDYKTVVLQGGESITIDLGKGQNKDGICPFLYARFGPSKANDAFGSKLDAIFKYKGSEAIRRSPARIDSQFSILGVHIEVPMELEALFTFQANEGAAPQYLDVKAWGITKGACKATI